VIGYTAVLVILCWSVLDREEASCSIDYKNETLSELHALASNSSSRFTDSEYFTISI